GSAVRCASKCACAVGGGHGLTRKPAGRIARAGGYGAGALRRTVRSALGLAQGLARALTGGMSALVDAAGGRVRLAGQVAGVAGERTRGRPVAAAAERGGDPAKRAAEGSAQRATETAAQQLGVGRARDQGRSGGGEYEGIGAHV